VGVPGLIALPSSGDVNRDEHRVAGVDVGEIAFDDLHLVPFGSPPVVAPHRVDRFTTDLADERRRAPTVLVRVRRASQVDPPHAGTLRRMDHRRTVRPMEASSRSTEFVALGHPGSERYAGLETFANPGVSHVEMRSDELTAVCPVTGQPDLYVATVEFWPQALCIESKSLKLYLGGFRNEGHFCEALAVKIRDDVAEALELPPDKVRVRLEQKARGGITITATS
jgi:7-cyano-7-deazaguanine reductase